MSRDDILPLVLDDVRLVLGNQPILHGISAAIGRGTRTLILGANGAGKSMLLRVCHGLIAPTSGRVRWASGAARPAQQAMVFQRPVMLRRSVLANVGYGLKLAGIGAQDRMHRAQQVLERVDLGAIAARSARVLSGGEQQRVALARAWALAPSILFLDEPTASLDPTAARNVEAIVQAIHDAGTKIVMTTHNLALARRFADDILLLHEGRLVESGPAAPFFSRPRTAIGRAFIDGELS
ncbi:MAG TPA: ATP-binding cassette domain-containing protein [Casimicrobiaceae bacterium]